MDIIWALVYGLIQGLTEFLPISSSGHLALLPKFFNVKDPGVIFDLVMHIGTAFAVILYFRKDILKLIQESIYLVTKDPKGHKGPFAFNFIIATVSSVFMILVLKDLAFSYGRTSTFIAFNLIFFGILMWLADRSKNAGVDLVKKRDVKKSILIGVCQSLAVFPGVSRSGATITAGRFLKMERQDASRFSFLLSLPIILASVAYKLPEILKGEAISVDPIIVVVGILVSFLCGILTIHFFLKFIAKVGLIHFSIYRIILGVIILILL